LSGFSPSPAEWICLGLLGGFLLLSAVCQVRSPVEDRIRQFDLFGWLPFWNFFAPRPGTLDFHLLYRDQISDGTITIWREIPLTHDRRWWNIFWNPGRREKKALFDAALGIRRYSARTGGDVRISVPYILLLTYVSGLRRIYPVEKTQFLVMASTPAEPHVDPQVLILSEMHPV
jgi:hypothetical protein